MREHPKYGEGLESFPAITEVVSVRFQRKTRLIRLMAVEFSGSLGQAATRYRCVFRVTNCSSPTFLPLLGSTPVTALHRYYGGSDSCTPLANVQVSLLHVLTLPDHSVPNHLVFPCRRFIPATLFSARQVSHLKTLCLFHRLRPSSEWV